MAKYLIHAIPKRMWYVNNYLIPSMLKQDIDKNDIFVYNDINRLGNLKACMQAFKSTVYDDSGTWHLQDDVLISRNFKEVTEKYDDGIVCGFCSIYDKNHLPGKVSLKEMWFSFPCIRIPNKIANDCADWVLNKIIGNPIYKDFWKDGNNDDWAFRSYLENFYKRITAINLNPNIVEHIDYLIGGTSSGIERDKKAVARFWQDRDLVIELKNKLEDSNALRRR